MSTRDTVAVVLPIRVRRLEEGEFYAQGCADDCPYRMPLARRVETVTWCSLFHRDIEADRRVPDCLTGGTAMTSDPHCVRLPE